MKLHFISLGCDKNLVDSERMLGMLSAAGHTITDDEMQAEACVINTCCFIHDAKQESIEAVLAVSELKQKAALKYLIVTGCLAERYKAEIIESIPEVDAVLGTAAYDQVVAVLEQLESGNNVQSVIIKDNNVTPELVRDRMLSGIDHYSYLKIAEGCNKRCTYCAIPYMKGNYRSADFDDLVREAQSLAERGINELMVIAQETTVYGVDLYGRKRLPELLKALCRIEGLDWIRLMYCYPEEITEELIDTIKSEKKICHYLDIPIQHSSDRILKAMGRRTNNAQLTEVISKLRREIPDIVLRTSLITGFPTETEEDHENLKSFIRDIKLERVGVFTYSREDGTPAAKLKPQIKAVVKKKQRKEIMLIQQENVLLRNSNLVGKTFDCIIDGRLPEEDVYVGRTYMDAPGIDGCVFVHSERELVGGTIIKIKVTGYNGYDLVADEI